MAPCSYSQPGSIRSRARLRFRFRRTGSPSSPERVIAEWLGRPRFAASSVARRLSAIRQLYRFLYAEGRRADDPSAVIEGPKRGRALPKVLSIAEVDRLLAQARADMSRAALASKASGQRGHSIVRAHSA